jgi:hypothetical protein
MSAKVDVEDYNDGSHDESFDEEAEAAKAMQDFMDGTSEDDQAEREEEMQRQHDRGRRRAAANRGLLWLSQLVELYQRSTWRKKRPTVRRLQLFVSEVARQYRLRLLAYGPAANSAQPMLSQLSSAGSFGRPSLFTLTDYSEQSQSWCSLSQSYGGDSHIERVGRFGATGTANLEVGEMAMELQQILCNFGTTLDEQVVNLFGSEEEVPVGEGTQFRSGGGGWIHKNSQAIHALDMLSAYSPKRARKRNRPPSQLSRGGGVLQYCVDDGTSGTPVPNHRKWLGAAVATAAAAAARGRGMGGSMGGSIGGQLSLSISPPSISHPSAIISDAAATSNGALEQMQVAPPTNVLHDFILEVDRRSPPLVQQTTTS